MSWTFRQRGRGRMTLLTGVMTVHEPVGYIQGVVNLETICAEWEGHSRGKVVSKQDSEMLLWLKDGYALDYWQYSFTALLFKYVFLFTHFVS